MSLNEVRHPLKRARAMLKVRLPQTALKSASPSNDGIIELHDPLKGGEAEIGVAGGLEFRAIEEYIVCKGLPAKTVSPKCSKWHTSKVALEIGVAGEGSAIEIGVRRMKVALALKSALPEKVAVKLAPSK